MGVRGRAVVCALGAWHAAVNCASRVPAHRGSQLELDHRAHSTRSKNPRGGREDEDEVESEGITGEKDKEGEGRRVAVASRRPAVASRRRAVASAGRQLESSRARVSRHRSGG